MPQPHLSLALAGILAASLPAQASFQVGAYGMIGDSDMLGYRTQSLNDFGDLTLAADNGSTVQMFAGPAGGGVLELVGSGNTWSQASASMQFKVRIDGDGYAPVEMRLTSFASTVATGEYVVRTRLSLTAAPLHPFDYYLPIAFSYSAQSCAGVATCAVSGTSGPGGWNLADVPFFMLPNRDYDLEMVVGMQQIQPDEWSIRNGFGGTLVDGYARGYVDPVFNFAPGVTGYTLTSSFPALPSAVPEPSEWWLLTAGAAVLVSTSRRRTRRNAC
jgi:hypothetical protein